MEERTIELTVISATDLKKVVKFGKQICYAVGYISSKQKKQTKKDSDGGVQPTWNEKLKFTCDEQQLLGGNLVLTVEIYSDGTFSDKLIGTVTIPISEIAKDSIGKAAKGDEKEEKEKEKEHEAQYLAFEVRRASGKSKGVLNAAIKFAEKRTIQVYQNQPPAGVYGYDQRAGQSSSDPQAAYAATGYPGYPPAPGYPNQYPPQPYGAPVGYPNQYPPQQVPYYPQQQAPYYPQQPPPYYQQQAPPRRGGGGGGMGLGLGAGLLGGAIGGLLIADAIDDIGDDGGDMDF